jgi:hypothetical protein
LRANDAASELTGASFSYAWVFVSPVSVGSCSLPVRCRAPRDDVSREVRVDYGAAQSNFDDRGGRDYPGLAPGATKSFDGTNIMLVVRRQRRSQNNFHAFGSSAV